MSGGLPAAYIASSRVRSASTSSISIFVVSCNSLRSSSPNSCESVMTTTFAGPLFFDVGCCWQATASGATAAAAATAPAPARRRPPVVRSCPWGAVTLGMVTTDVSDHFFAEAVAGAEAESRKHGFFLIIGSIEPGSEDDERTYLRLMLERRVEGLIIAVPRLLLAEDDILREAADRVPTVVLASNVELPAADHVDIDNRRG